MGISKTRTPNFTRIWRTYHRPIIQRNTPFSGEEEHCKNDGGTEHLWSNQGSLNAIPRRYNTIFSRLNRPGRGTEGVTTSREFRFQQRKISIEGIASAAKALTNWQNGSNVKSLINI